jgi:hypothetical protein
MTKKPVIVPIDWINPTERFAVIGGYDRGRRKPRLKEFYRARGNCHFSRGIPRGLIDFAYRAVVKLGLRKVVIFFSRGAVKRNGKSLVNTVALRRLDWDAGISVIIPQRLRYSARVSLSVNGAHQDFRVMELALLMALLSLAAEKKSGRWYADMAATIVAEGWSRLDKGVPSEVVRSGLQAGSRGETKGRRTMPAHKPMRKPAP